jgi:hypothetical protein
MASSHNCQIGVTNFTMIAGALDFTNVTFIPTTALYVDGYNAALDITEIPPQFLAVPRLTLRVSYVIIRHHHHRSTSNELMC